jgi:hypothetical protein
MTRPLFALAGVCARHGLLTVRDEDGWHCGVKPGGNIYELVQGCATEADAVCALLKARWGIMTRIDNAQHGWPWLALHTRPEHDALNEPPSQSQRFLTELAAVVALADRLLATPDATTGGAA